MASAGAVAFLRSISLEALGLGAQLAAGAHELLYHTELALGGKGAAVACTAERGEFCGKLNQPGDTREGIQQVSNDSVLQSICSLMQHVPSCCSEEDAYVLRMLPMFTQACESISRGLERTASSLVGNPVKVYQRGAGAGVAVACALRAAPAAAVAPAAAAVGAVRCALLGVRNG